MSKTGHAKHALFWHVLFLTCPVLPQGLFAHGAEKQYHVLGGATPIPPEGKQEILIHGQQ